MRSVAHNILALSDLHLGSDVADGTQPRVTALDRALARFLAHHTARREDGLPWRLIFAGDLVDFPQVTLVPQGGEGIEPDEEERRWGLHSGEDRAVWKLALVLRRHDLVVQRLAEFVAAGNSLVVVRGNHDMEFYWPRVQELFRATLAEKAAGADQAALLARIEFHDWFYLEPGRIYLEHGHVHDEYSTVDDVLQPLAREAPRLLDLPISSMALRYFGVKYHRSLDPAEVESWGFWDFVRWGLRGQPGFVRVFLDYLVMVWRVLYPTFVKGRLWSRRATRMGERIVGDRVERVKNLLNRFVGHGEGLGRLALALVSAAKPPASRQLLDALQLFFVDRMLLGGAAVALSGAAMAAPAPRWAQIGSLAAIAAGAVWANARLSARRRIESHPKLMEAAARLGPLLGVPYVVMGHSHKPVAAFDLGNGTRYFNLGTWAHGPSGAPPRHGLTHLVLAGDRAELRRWEPDAEQAVAPAPAPAPA